MQVRLGCMTRPWGGEVPIERALEGIAKAGYTFTAFLGRHPGYWFYEYLLQPEEEINALKRTVDSFGLKVVTAWGGNPVQYGVEGMRKTADRAAELGLEYVILSSPYVSSNQPQPSDEELLEKFKAAIEPVLPRLEETGVRFDVKPHMGRYGTGAGLRELVEQIDHPLLGVSYDPGNIRYYEGIDPNEDLKDVAPRVTSLCIKDHQGPARSLKFPVPGEGDVNWPSIFGTLGEAGFDGYALIEAFDGEGPEQVDAAVVGARRDLARWIEEAGGTVILK